MITRLLNLSGVYLGAEHDMIPPLADDNPDGYWEHLPLADLNNDLLAALGGSWDRPPSLTAGWEKAAALDPFRERARTVFTTLQEQPDWGWKNPRNCLTLPFWLDLMPDLQLVCPVRNPLEVAASMSTGTPHRTLRPDAALGLWIAYHEALLGVVRPDQIIVTHYDAYFYDPAAELRRVLDRLSISVSHTQIQSACQSVHSRSRHNLSHPYLLDEPGIPATVPRIYGLLTAQAGPVYAQMTADEPYQIRQWTRIIHDQNIQLHAQAERLRQLEERQRVLENDFTQATHWSASLQADLTKRLAEIEIAREHIALLTHQLNAHESLGVRARRFVRSLKNGLNTRSRA